MEYLSFRGSSGDTAKLAGTLHDMTPGEIHRLRNTDFFGWLTFARSLEDSLRVNTLN